MSVQRSVSPNEMIAERMLANKMSDTAEIEIHLFENCNISCGYCSQNHNDGGPNQESFDRKQVLAVKYMMKFATNYKKCRINLMGGEMFQDKFDNDVWNMYEQLIVDLYRAASLLYEEVHIGATSNLLFNKDTQYKLEVLLFSLKTDHNVDFRLKTSYDLRGRPLTDSMMKTFLANFGLFRGNLDLLSVCLHKPNILALISGKDTMLDYFAADIELCFDWYIPDEKNADKYFPTDEECKQALLYIMKKYPNSSPVREMLEDEVGNVQCCSENRVLIPANEIVSNCIYLNEEYKNPINRDTTYDKAATFIEEQGCMTCEHFMKCSLYCYAASDYAKRIQNATCFIRDAYDQSISERDSNKS